MSKHPPVAGEHWQFNDGGRAAAGFKGSAGDCVTRAVAIASGRPYREVYDALAGINAGLRITKRRQYATHPAGKRSARNGVPTKSKAFHAYMRSLGFEWVATMAIGTGCKVHLDPAELPPTGRLVVHVSKHVCAVINGVIQDTYDPRRKPYIQLETRDGIETRTLVGGRCVYGYWKLQ